MNNQPNKIDPYNGFMRGNLFDNLYDPYKNYMYTSLNPDNERDYLLLMVQAYSFALTELDLFLDTNPNNANAISLYNNYLNLYKQSLNQYESKYGPLTLTSNALNKNYWAWNNNPWPWEVSANV